MEYTKPNGYKNINTSLALFSSNMQDREERLIQRIQELELKNKKLIDEKNRLYLYLLNTVLGFTSLLCYSYFLFPEVRF